MNDYLNPSVIVTPVWILLGGVSVLFTLFTRKLAWIYAFFASSVLLAALSLQAGVSELRERHAEQQRIGRAQEELKGTAEQLNLGFVRLGIALKLPPSSPRETILIHAEGSDSVRTGDSGTAIATPPKVGLK